MKDKIKNFNWIYFPIVFAIIAILLGARLTITHIHPELLIFHTESPVAGIFVGFKYNMFIIAGVLSAIYIAVMYKKFEVPKNKLILTYLIATAVFVGFTFISALNAEFKGVAFSGSYDVKEGFYTILIYAIIFIFAMFLSFKNNNIKYLAVPLAIVVVGNVITELVSIVADKNFYDIAFIRKALSPTQYWDQIVDANSSTIEGQSGGTIGHYNYMGSFLAMAMPFFATLTLVEKNKKYRIFWAIITLLTIFMLFRSTARSALIGIAVAIVLGIIVFIKPIIANIKITAIALVFGVVAIFGINAVSNNALSNRIPQMVEDMTSLFVSSDNIDYKDMVPVKNVAYENGDLLLETQFDTIKISYNNDDTLSFIDGNQQEIISTITPAENSTSYTFAQEEMAPFQIEVLPFSDTSFQKCLIRLYHNGVPVMYFSVNAENELFVASPYTYYEIELDNPEVYLFEGKEQLGSARGYIWGRTLPMLKDTLFIGYGPDNFIFKFPQYDFIGKLYVYGDFKLLVTKPHNLYLQILVNNGGIAFLGFATIVGVYLISSLKIYLGKAKKANPFGKAIFLAILGYLGAGLFNDSIMYVSFLFWILLGFGIGINYNDIKNNKESNI